MMREFINFTDLKFIDISSEKSRTYSFPGGDEVTINLPCKLNVSKSGGHRLFSADGVSHYIPNGWIHLSWIVEDGHPHFVA